LQQPRLYHQLMGLFLRAGQDLTDDSLTQLPDRYTHVPKNWLEDERRKRESSVNAFQLLFLFVSWVNSV